MPAETPAPIAPSVLAAVERLLGVVAQLRHPVTGCPWDLKQTHASLRPYLLEEAYEAVEVMDGGQPQALQEELGDVLLQVALHAQLAQDAGTFDFGAICHTLADKLIRRHPHVFGDVSVDSPEAVTRNWEAIKRQEKEAAPTGDMPPSVLAGVSKQQPALSRALETSKRAVKVGFDWPDFQSLWDCVMSEFDEFRHEVETTAPQERLEDELGDILFATVNLARRCNIDPEVALTRATSKFTQRFQVMEGLAPAPLETLDFKTWDALWRQAKTKLSSMP